MELLPPYAHRIRAFDVRSLVLLDQVVVVGTAEAAPGMSLLYGNKAVARVRFSTCLEAPEG